MKPGRELDTLIAEKITKVGHEGAPPVPQYSTSIADAFLLIEKFDEYQVGMMIVGESSPVVPGALLILSGRRFTGFGESVAHSICLAAIKTLDL